MALFMNSAHANLHTWKDPSHISMSVRGKTEPGRAAVKTEQVSVTTDVPLIHSDAALSLDYTYPPGYALVRLM